MSLVLLITRRLEFLVNPSAKSLRCFPMSSPQSGSIKLKSCRWWVGAVGFGSMRHSAIHTGRHQDASLIFRAAELHFRVTLKLAVEIIWIGLGCSDDPKVLLADNKASSSGLKLRKLQIKNSVPAAFSAPADTEKFIQGWSLTKAPFFLNQCNLFLLWGLKTYFS